MEVTVCDRCGRRLDPALGGKGYLGLATPIWTIPGGTAPPS